MKNFTKLLIVSIIIAFFIGIWLNYPVCEQIPKGEESTIEVGLTVVEDNKYISANQFLIVKANEFWDIELPFEEVTDENIIEKIKEISNITENVRIFYVTMPVDATAKYRINNTEIEIPLSEGIEFDMGIQSQELECKPRYKWILEMLK